MPNENEFPFVHEFTGPNGIKYKVKFLGEDDAMHHPETSKRIIVGPGIVFEEHNGGSMSWRIVSGCKEEFLADNYSEAAALAEKRVTC